MSLATVTFDEIERNADEAFAYALLARLAKNYLICAYRSHEVASALEQLLGVLKPEQLQALTAEQMIWLTKRLQELHRLLAEYSRSRETEAISRLPLLAGVTARVRNATEDLDDIIEDLVLVGNEDFQALIS